SRIALRPDATGSAGRTPASAGRQFSRDAAAAAGADGRPAGRYGAGTAAGPSRPADDPRARRCAGRHAHADGPDQSDDRSVLAGRAVQPRWFSLVVLSAQSAGHGHSKSDNRSVLAGRSVPSRWFSRGVSSAVTAGHGQYRIAGAGIPSAAVAVVGDVVAGSQWALADRRAGTAAWCCRGKESG